MEFFIDNKDTEAKFKEIFKKISILRNGETHHEMKKFGLNYQKSLGVTVVNLRELAAKYEQNHLLAHKLWVKEFRETRIVASLLEEPEKVETAQLERWFQDMESNELYEQISMNLLIHLPNIHQLLQDWLQSGNYKKVVCAVLVLGRMALLKRKEDIIGLVNFVEFIPENIDENYLKNQVKRSLGKIVRLNKELADKISTRVNQLKNKDENWQEVWDDLQYELEL
ncbi:DNA alkylation repair protein [Marinifilum sp. RC60d5]|uniref:DNA alkylation repair protein n=1 Tax=Marinifilum sp. RC60d5 TaxID=3458414 RepID=UPI0040370DA0